ncbi:type II toxin-antitoxin system PemK/MazF family toxin [Bacillus mycoides]|uniref:type II toxin-antitoxin system PemK/MazF family toxin n=1 Tax=Bacillus mycoides TaxID=1405 RepID=UPI003D026793
MTKSTEKIVKQGEIWIANVKFVQDNSTKVRPVLAVSLEIDGDGDVVVLPVSSQNPRNDYDVEVSNYSGTGLLVQPSYIRTAKPLTIEKRALKRKIGEMNEVDLANALEKLRSLF